MNKLLHRSIGFMMALVLTLGSHYSALASGAAGIEISGQQIPLLNSNIYYVSTTGLDTNSGSATAPFKTFAKAVSVLTAGDTLQVTAGTYIETLTLSKSGTNIAPITVVGNGAILNMQGLGQNGITISGSYIHVSGFEVIGAIDFGILATGKYDVIENNSVHDNVTKNGVGICGISTSWGSGVKVRVGGENTTIRNNTVYNNCGEGIAVTRGVVAVVENNTTYDNFSVNIYVDNSPFVTVQNNVSHCTGTHLRDGSRATGIALGEESYSGWGAQLHDILITSNQITDCRTGIAVFASNVGGTLTNMTLSSNRVPSGQSRSISLQTLTNQNILVANNTLFNSIYISQTTGVTLVGNIIGGVASTSTSLPAPTSTKLASSSTPTSTLPAATVTASPVPASPTAIAPTSTFPAATTTASPIPASPTTVAPTSTLPAATITASLILSSPTASAPITTPTTTLVPALPTLTSTSIPLTATLVVTNPASLGKVYDDKDNGLIYSAGWRDVTKRQAYGGSYKLTTQNGASVTFAFTGQSFSVIYKGGSASRKMDVYVDNVLAGTIDERASLSTFQLRWDYSGQLSPGNHTLKLVFVTTNTSGGTNGSIDAVIVR